MNHQANARVADMLSGSLAIVQQADDRTVTLRGAGTDVTWAVEAVHVRPASVPEGAEITRLESGRPS